MSPVCLHEANKLLFMSSRGDTHWAHPWLGPAWILNTAMNSYMTIIKEVRQPVILGNIYLTAEHDFVGQEEHEGGNSSVQNTPGAGVGEGGAQEAATASQQAEPERGTN